MTTSLLDDEGVIRWIYRPDTYRVRASVDEILTSSTRSELPDAPTLGYE